MTFESKRGSKEGKKNAFCKLESLFFFLWFFHWSFSFALQRWFQELEVTLHNILKSLKIEDRQTFLIQQNNLIYAKDAHVLWYFIFLKILHRVYFTFVDENALIQI